MTKEKSVETCLVLSTGLLFLYFVFHLQVCLTVSFIIGIIGVFIKPIAIPISWFWIKLGEMMGFITSKIVLTVVFFVFLLPISAFYRIVKKDTFGLKNNKGSYWKDRQKKFIPNDLDNIW
jgi:hypothetical protein